MKKAGFRLSLVCVACMAGPLLTVSPSRAENIADDHARHEGRQHEHSGHEKKIPKTPQQKEAMALFKKGNAMCDAGEYEDSLAVYTQAISLDPNFTEAYYKRGKAFYRLGGDLSALEDFSKVIELSPENADAYFQRGIVWNHIGDEAKMIEDFKAAARLGEVDHTKHEHIMK